MEESQATSSDAIAIDDAANAPEMGKEEQDKRNTQEVQKSSERHGRHVEMKDTSNDQKGARMEVCICLMMKSLSSVGD
jgi:hypothetical protein